MSDCDSMAFEFDDDINYIINEHKNAKKELEESEKICQTEQLLIDENDNLMEEAVKMIGDGHKLMEKACNIVRDGKELMQHAISQNVVAKKKRDVANSTLRERRLICEQLYRKLIQANQSLQADTDLIGKKYKELEMEKTKSSANSAASIKSDRTFEDDVNTKPGFDHKIDYTAEIKACYKAYMVKFEAEQAKKKVHEENEIKNGWNVSREIVVEERKRNINLENTVYANTDNGSFIYTEEILSKQHASSIASLSYPIPPSTTGSSIYTEDLQSIKPREEIIFSCSCHLFSVSRADPKAPQNQNTCELDIKRIVNENSTRYKYEIWKDAKIYYVSEEFIKASFGVYIKMKKSTKNIPYLVMTFKFEDSGTHYDLSYLTLEDADMEKFCEIVRREDFKTEATTFNT